MKKIIIIPAVMLVLVLFFYLSRFNVKENLYVCHSQIVEINADSRIDLLLSVHLNIKNNNGELTLEGTVVPPGKMREMVNRQILFNYTADDNFYTFNSTKIIPNRGEHIPPESLIGLIPDFFIKEKNSISYLVSSVGGSGYVFSVAGIPRFYCKKDIK